VAAVWLEYGPSIRLFLFYVLALAVVAAIVP
jgi:hypothetical protein